MITTASGHKIYYPGKFMFALTCGLVINTLAYQNATEFVGEYSGPSDFIVMAAMNMVFQGILVALAGNLLRLPRLGKKWFESRRPYFVTLSLGSTAYLFGFLSLAGIMQLPFAGESLTFLFFTFGLLMIVFALSYKPE